MLGHEDRFAIHCLAFPFWRPLVNGLVAFLSVPIKLLAFLVLGTALPQLATLCCSCLPLLTRGFKEAVAVMWG